MTRISYEDEFGEITIKLEKDEMTLDEVLFELVLPALQSAGFFVDDLEHYLQRMED